MKLEDFYQLIAGYSDTGYLMISSSGDIIESDHCFSELLHSSSETLKGKKISDYTDDGFMTHIHNFFSSNTMIGKKFKANFYLPDLNRFEIELFPCLIENGQLQCGLICHSSNELLSLFTRSEERFRLLTELTIDGASSVFIDSAGKINREWIVAPLMARFGYHENDLDTVEKWASIVYPDDRHIFFEGYQFAVKGKEYQADIRVLTKDGQIKWINHKIIPQFTSSGLRILSAVKDITAAKEAELKLVESEQKYRSLAENLDVCIFRFSTRAHLIFYNNSAHRLIVSSFSVLYKNKTVQLSDFFYSMVEKANGKNEVIHTQIFINELERYFDWRIIPECDNSGKTISVLMVGYDITMLKKTENDLKIALKNAERSDQLKSVFLANISHEIRTPLNAIIGFSQLLNDGNHSSEFIKEALEIVSDSGNQLLSIINELIDIAKIESGEFSYNPEPVNIREVVNHVYSAFMFNLKKSGKENKIEIKVIPDTSIENVEILTDKVKLIQILNNLLNNALKFTDKGLISISYFVDNNYIVFKVQDTGIGIPSDKHEIIFESFRQADSSTSRKYSGAGLGLSICRSLVNLLNGKIWLESAPSAGSTFYFTIPYQQPRPADRPKPQSYDKNFLNQKVIMVVEDDPANLFYMQSLLESFMAVVICFQNGEDAVQYFLNNQHIDLVFMDIQLPGISGYDVTRQIRAVNQSVPVVALTGYAFHNEKEKCLSSGCTDYLSKPVNPNSLIRLLYALFNK